MVFLPPSIIHASPQFRPQFLAPVISLLECLFLPFLAGKRNLVVQLIILRLNFAQLTTAGVAQFVTLRTAIMPTSVVCRTHIGTLVEGTGRLLLSRLIVLQTGGLRTFRFFVPPAAFLTGFVLLRTAVGTDRIASGRNLCISRVGHPYEESQQA